mmetsp:Transcript_119242/g.380123  ORF Transcript_119242/g.380123 Transcript_119242/m.380123 type:complete len:354 (+) Transcript_119242:212-1273(+)
MTAPMTSRRAYGTPCSFVFNVVPPIEHLELLHDIGLGVHAPDLAQKVLGHPGLFVREADERHDIDALGRASDALHTLAELVHGHHPILADVHEPEEGVRLLWGNAHEAELVRHLRLRQHGLELPVVQFTLVGKGFAEVVPYELQNLALDPCQDFAIPLLGIFLHLGDLFDHEGDDDVQYSHVADDNRGDEEHDGSPVAYHRQRAGDVGGPGVQREDLDDGEQSPEHGADVLLLIHPPVLDQWVVRYDRHEDDADGIHDDDHQQARPHHGLQSVEQPLDHEPHARQSLDALDALRDPQHADDSQRGGHLEASVLCSHGDQDVREVHNNEGVVEYVPQVIEVVPAHLVLSPEHLE